MEEKINKVRIDITRRVKLTSFPNKNDRYPALAEALGITFEEAESKWNWVSGSNSPVEGWPQFRDITDTFVRDLRTNREKIDTILAKQFPNRLMTFYTDNGPDEVAAVEDADGTMWRVWADGDTQQYK